MKSLFWISILGVAYAYLGYPLLLRALAAVMGGDRKPEPRSSDDRTLPSVTMIVPVHNEEAVIAAKLDNLAALDYPRDRLEVFVVSDGSTDRTADIVRSRKRNGLRLLEATERGGKARALNCGLAEAKGEVVCFTDASILLEPGALRALMRRFDDPAVGCASGEDVIRAGGGERLYGMYELGIRRLESAVSSIVGASGSFYAQRRALCREFPEGLAPDFLSVLDTVGSGFRGVTEPRAVGVMTSVDSSGAEFQRKVRTLLRGMATLRARLGMLNPVRHGAFALLLFSHKLMRWWVPFFLLLLLAANAFLLDGPLYAAFFVAQVAFYGLAMVAWAGVGAARNSVLGKVALYFAIVNLATLVAWWKFVRGARQEIWNPTRREPAQP
jgi:cellulose synthase/poly-beta-1,6-N-acetylglucosamine synthase-like glycosyltransferase